MADETIAADGIVNVKRFEVWKAIYHSDPIEPRIGRRQARYPCPVKGCGAPITRSRLMCLSCWRRLPAKVRKGQEQHYRDIRGPGRTVEAFQAYRERCVDSVILAEELRNG